MSLNLNSKVKMLFTTLAIIFFIGGCPPDNTISPVPPDPTETDFNGTYRMYEELSNCSDPNCHNIVGYDNYQATIEQTGNQAQLTVNDQPLSCTVTEDELTCEGTYTYTNGDRISYTSYTLFSNDTDNTLTGSAEWTYSNENGNYSGDSVLTTTIPESGSIKILNSSYATYQTLNLNPCGSDSWNTITFPSPLTPIHYIYLYDVHPGCYILYICEDIAATDCPLSTEITVNRAETYKIEITPSNASAVQLSLSPN
jgi:hypothetical protein